MWNTFSQSMSEKPSSLSKKKTQVEKQYRRFMRKEKRYNLLEMQHHWIIPFY